MSKRYCIDIDVGVNEEVDAQTQVTSEAASGTRKKFDDLLVYPTTLRQSNQDTIHFTMMEYVAKGLGGDAGQFGGGQRTNNRKSIGRVVLPIPAGINDSNQVKWASGEMNAGQMALAGIALEGITNGLKSAGEEAAKQIKKARQEIDSQRDEALNQLKSEADNLGDLIVERLLAKK